MAKKRTPVHERRCALCGRNGNARTQEILHTFGQTKAMKEQGWTKEQFRAEFGKNYL